MPVGFLRGSGHYILHVVSYLLDKTIEAEDGTP